MTPGPYLMLEVSIEKAVSFGIDIKSDGYHIFALGPTGTGKTSIIKKFLQGKTHNEPIPDDWAYVNNFEDSDKPKALRMPLRLVAFPASPVETEEYEADTEKLQQSFQEDRQNLFSQIESKVQEKGFGLLQTPQGIVVVPTKDGEAIGPEKIAEMEQKQQDQLLKNRELLQEELRETVKKVHKIQKDLKKELRELDRRTVGFAVSHLIDDLTKKYGALEQVVKFINSVREDILDNVQEFKQPAEEETGSISSWTTVMRREPQ